MIPQPEFFGLILNKVCWGAPYIDRDTNWIEKVTGRR